MKIIDTFFAWISLIAGYIFCRVYPISENPLGGFIFIGGIFAITTTVLILKGYRIKAPAIFAAVSALMVSATLIVSSNEFLSFFAYAYGLVAFCYYIFAGTGNTLEQGFSDLIFVDYFKSLFVMPFTSLGNLFKGLFANTKKENRNVFLKLLLGIGLTIIPTAIVLTLLSYDKNFSNILKNIFSFNFNDIWSHFVSINLGIPVGMYIFGLFSASNEKKCAEIITTEGCERVSNKVKIAPTITIISAIAPMLFVYIIFFISQWDYYISGFTGVLPEEFSYAEYAREGFFQLCAVSVINLFVILLSVMFMKRKDNKPSIAAKIVTIIFSIATLILISTALAKMFMYINYYGLTQLRVYSTWFMGVIAMIFVIIILKQFIPKFKALVTSFIMCVVLFGALGILNVDSFIANYNVDRYLSGSLDEIDIDTLRDLEYSAVPAMVKLYETLDEKDNISETETQTKNTVQDILNVYAKIKKNYRIPFWSYNLPYFKANDVLEDYY